VGIWRRLFRSPADRRMARTLRELGMPERNIDWTIKADKSHERHRKEAFQKAAAMNPSEAPTHGSPLGTSLACEECGRQMLKLGPGENSIRGSIVLSPGAVARGAGVAEECRECGRAYCSSCYPGRSNRCVCGIHPDTVRVEKGIAYRGSLVLVRVEYPS
jgi:hypothetical protein